MTFDTLHFDSNLMFNPFVLWHILVTPLTVNISIVLIGAICTFYTSIVSTYESNFYSFSSIPPTTNVIRMLDSCLMYDLSYQCVLFFLSHLTVKLHLKVKLDKVNYNWLACFFLFFFVFFVGHWLISSSSNVWREKK